MSRSIFDRSGTYEFTPRQLLNNSPHLVFVIRKCRRYVPNFIAEAKKADLVADSFKDAEAIGPLASFRSGDFWVEHPYSNGVALVGDAASTSDPAFGQGLSTTLRDVRVLRDASSGSSFRWSRTAPGRPGKTEILW